MFPMKLGKFLIQNVVLLALLVSSAAWTSASKVNSTSAVPAGPDAVIAWNAITLRAVLTVGLQPPPASFVYASYVQAAVYNAVVAIEGGYQPYKSSLAARPEASVDAAVAAAAHDVLVHYFPSQQTALDADYLASLASIPDGIAKTGGIEVGAGAANELIALRQGDGLNVNIGFTMPAPAPGVWQLPSGVSPLVPWMSQLRPFMLERPDQFRPGPPPDLSSPEWAAEYNEVRIMGHRASSVRTPEQTNVARFWTTPTLFQYNTAFQQAVLTRGLSAVEAARLMAMGNMVGADALIGCFDTKYHYLFWRPQFAVPQGETDGNPQTPGDPNFIPLIGTPAHPEYPSAHGCVTSAIAEVLTDVLRTQEIEVDIPSTVPGIPTRHFSTAKDLVKDVINARVWGGIHYRESVVIGANLGRKVAHWTLQRYFLPEH
jgi:hypothetical protein